MVVTGTGRGSHEQGTDPERARRGSHSRGLQRVEMRRFVPIGKGDTLRLRPDGVDVFVRQEPCWLPVDPVWEWQTTVNVGPEQVGVTFKEIETSAEMARFDSLRRFHYRGGGGAGRSVPIIAETYEGRGDSGKATYRRFCPECGSPVAIEVELMPETVMIPVGTLDDKNGVRPAMQIYCDSAQPWAVLEAGIQRFPKMPMPGG